MKLFSINLGGGSSGGGAVWGAITGTLSDQLDLQAALNAKVEGGGTTVVGRIVVWDDTVGGSIAQAGGLGFSNVYGTNDPTITAPSSLTVQISSSDHTYFTSSTLNIVGSRNLIWNTNGGGDIGTNSGNRPRWIYSNGGFSAKGDHYYQDAVGKSMIFTTGTNAKIGTSATLVGGTVTVNTTAVGANSMVILNKTAAGGIEGFVRVSVSAGTSFTITSSSGTDTSTFDWFIIERQ